jgi:hypothetical protein
MYSKPEFTDSIVFVVYMCDIPWVFEEGKIVVLPLSLSASSLFSAETAWAMAASCLYPSSTPCDSKRRKNFSSTSWYSSRTGVSSDYALRFVCTQDSLWSLYGNSLAMTSFSPEKSSVTKTSTFVEPLAMRFWRTSIQNALFSPPLFTQ